MRSLAFAIFVFFSGSVLASVDARISLGKTGGRSVRVVVSLINNTAKTICINSAALGLDGAISEPLFNVARDSQPLEFSGIREIKTSQPDRSFLVLVPQQEISVSHDLSAYYDFSLPGRYRINFDTMSIGKCRGVRGGMEFKSNYIFFERK